MFPQSDGASPDACDSAGNPALVVSARVRALECVLALLDAGAKVTATNVELETALHVAAEAGDVAVAESLMAADAGGKLSDMRDARGRLARDLFPEQSGAMAQHPFAVVSGWGRAVLSKGRAMSALEAATGGKSVASNAEAANALGLLGVPLASSEGAAAMVEGASVSDAMALGGKGEEGATWDREAFAAAVEGLAADGGLEHPTSPAASSTAGCSPRANGAARATAHVAAAAPDASLEPQGDCPADAAAASVLAQASSDTDTEVAKAPAGMVFLGGACGSTTWRAETAVPWLTEAGIPFFNPQLGEGEWNETAVEREAVAKQAAGTLLFVFTSCTRAVSSCIEAAEFATVAAHTAQDVVLVIQDIEAGTAIEGDVSRAVWFRAERRGEGARRRRMCRFLARSAHRLLRSTPPRLLRPATPPFQPRCIACPPLRRSFRRRKPGTSCAAAPTCATWPAAAERTCLTRCRSRSPSSPPGLRSAACEPEARCGAFAAWRSPSPLCAQAHAACPFAVLCFGVHPFVSATVYLCAPCCLAPACSVRLCAFAPRAVHKLPLQRPLTRCQNFQGAHPKEASRSGWRARGTGHGRMLSKRKPHSRDCRI